MKKLLPILLLILPLALLAQDAKQFKQTVALDGAKTGNIRLELPAGELHLKTGSKALLDASITYDRADWKPSVNINKNDGAASLTINQKNTNNKESSGENKWNVSLNKNIPLNLHLTMGAGTSKLDLNNSNLKKLKIEAGAVSMDVNLGGSAVKEVDIAAGVGELNVDLTGNWDHDVDIEVTGGIGEVNISVPKNTGVLLNATGIGTKNLNGFKKNGSHHQNAAYGKSKHTLTIKVSGGMGNINVTEV